MVWRLVGRSVVLRLGPVGADLVDSVVGKVCKRWPVRAGNRIVGCYHRGIVLNWELLIAPLIAGFDTAAGTAGATPLLGLEALAGALAR